MTVELVKLEKIIDNVDNPRSKYDLDVTKDLASSIKQNGLLQMPRARKNPDGNYELATGGYRFRAFKLIAKEGSETWTPAIIQYIVDGGLAMPLDIAEIEDPDMGIIAVDENNKRSPMKPMDLAYFIDHQLNKYASLREETLAIKMSMSQGNLSNMRRIVKLPKDVLKYVDDETINFTMARELLTISSLDAETKGAVEAKLVMIDAINLVGTDGIASSVTGLRKAIHKAVKMVVADGRLREVTKDTPSANPPRFLVESCVKCQKVLKTTDENGKASYTCMDLACWDLNQTNAKRKEDERLQEEARLHLEAENERERAEKEARQKVEEAAANPQNISQEIKAPVTGAVEPRVILVAKERIASGDIFKSFSGAEIFSGEVDEKVEINPPFEDAGELYVSVGAPKDNPNVRRAYRLVARIDYKNEIRRLHNADNTAFNERIEEFKLDPLGTYNGVLVRYQGGELVMVGPMVLFSPDKKKTAVEHIQKIVKDSGVPDGHVIVVPVTGVSPTIEKHEEEPANAKESPVESPTESKTGDSAPVFVAPVEAKSPVQAESTMSDADELYTVSLTISVVVPAGIVDKEERESRAWDEFKTTFEAGAYDSSDISITLEKRE
jgi:ParB/RepB/Spo0J family partition protein